MNEVERHYTKEKCFEGEAKLESKSGSYFLRFNLSRELKSEKDPGYREQGRAFQVKKHHV